MVLVAWWSCLYVAITLCGLYALARTIPRLVCTGGVPTFPWRMMNRKKKRRSAHVKDPPRDRPKKRRGCVDRPVRPNRNRGGMHTRRDINSMTHDEQSRFCEAVIEMMSDGSAETPSTYLRLTRVHGWDQHHCVHRTESFACWHRAFLVEFERALQAKDDGLTLPYWNWASNPELPACIRTHFGSIPSVLREELLREYERRKTAKCSQDVEEDGVLQVISRGYDDINDDVAFQRQIHELRLLDVLHLFRSNPPPHSIGATTGGGAHNSLEYIHDIIHAATGFPMTDLTFAAFHPVFFLHHCFVDLLYEGYLRDRPGAWHEFEQTQGQMEKLGRHTNAFASPLTPFNVPVRELRFPQHWGYCYDTLSPHIPKPVPFDSNELPKRYPAPTRVCTLVTFAGIRPTDLFPHRYTCHVFVFKNSKKHTKTNTEGTERRTAVAVATLAKARREFGADAKRDDVPSSTGCHTPSAYTENVVYAGACVILCGQGRTRCRNCARNNPISLAVDITFVEERWSCSLGESNLVVICEDEHGCQNELLMLRSEGVMLPLPAISHLSSSN